MTVPIELPSEVSDEARSLFLSGELSDARLAWVDQVELLDQIDYQLDFRDSFDYLSTDADHLGMLLSARPKNVGIEDLNLYLSQEEALEFTRRDALGDQMDLIISLVDSGGVGPSFEGDDRVHGENYAGVWQDQQDGGVLIIATTDESSVPTDLIEEVVDLNEYRVLEVERSWNEIESISDEVFARGQRLDFPADVFINSTSRGRELELVTPRPSNVPPEILEGYESLVVVSEGPVARPESNPTGTHSASKQQPGLEIYERESGDICTWGVNGHTSSFNYILTAGHCGVTAKGDDYSAYTNELELYQNDSFHLTSGSVYVKSEYDTAVDAKRVSSSYANDNCYHAGADCRRFIRYRALHNSWDINSDIDCASLGRTNDYRCGLVVQENADDNGCIVNDLARIDVDTRGGDSGSGFVHPRSSGATFTALHVCGGGPGDTQSLSVTAFDVKNNLDFDYNCHSSTAIRSPTQWGTCPAINR